MSDKDPAPAKRTAEEAEMPQLSRGKLKKQRKKEERMAARNEGDRSLFLKLYGENALASLQVSSDTLRSRSQSSLRIMDLQNLLVWVLGESLSPNWVFVRNKPLIENVMVVVVHNLTQTLFKQYGNAFSALSDIAASTTRGEVVPTMVTPETKIASLHHAGLIPLVVPFSMFQRNVVTQRLFEYQGASNAKKKKQSKKREQAHSSNSDTKTHKNLPLPVTYVLSDDALLEHKYPKYASFQETGEDDEVAMSSSSSSASPSTSCGCIELSFFPCQCNDAKTSCGDEGEHLSPRLFGLDCEMVNTEASKFALARVSLVCGETHNVLYDSLVRPPSPVTDYLTRWSGITAEMLAPVTTTLHDVQAKLKQIINRNDILVGHSLENDLWALRIYHDRILDTAVLFPHSRGGQMKNSLKYLARKYLSEDIQEKSSDRRGHCSSEDALAALKLAQLKIAKGPDFGVPAATVFEALPTFFCKKKTIIIDSDVDALRACTHGDINAVPCSNDEEIVTRAARALNGQERIVLFAHLREIHPACTFEDFMSGTVPAVAASVEAVNNKLQRLYEAAAPNTLVMICSGDSDVRGLSALRSYSLQPDADPGLNAKFETWQKACQHGLCAIGIKGHVAR